MATEKQRKRRAKEKRHEYDLVFIDEDGVERPVETEARKPPPRVARGKGKSSGGKGGKPQRAASSGRKPPPPPSWQRVGKRGLIFAPVFFITVVLLSGKGFTASHALSALGQSALLIAVFIPFSYFMDRIVWRQYLKRSGNAG